MTRVWLSVLLCCSFFVSADSSREIEREVNHLLQFVKNTGCEYERNGKRHSGSDALEHIKKKYNYYEDDIDSAESFVKLAATKSTMSGRYYLVHCAGKPVIKSKDWLLAELALFRQSKHKP